MRERRVFQCMSAFTTALLIIDPILLCTADSTGEWVRVTMSLLSTALAAKSTYDLAQPFIEDGAKNGLNTQQALRHALFGECAKANKQNHPVDAENVAPSYVIE